MSRIKFMGEHHRKLWWNIATPNGWLVVHLGRFRWKGRGWWRFSPRAYWSPNGTPWHHGARSIFRERRVDRAVCVCEVCRPEGTEG